MKNLYENIRRFLLIDPSVTLKLKAEREEIKRSHIRECNVAYHQLYKMAFTENISTN